MRIGSCRLCHLQCRRLLHPQGLMPSSQRSACSRLRFGLLSSLCNRLCLCLGDSLGDSRGAASRRRHRFGLQLLLLASGSASSRHCCTMPTQVNATWVKSLIVQMFGTAFGPVLHAGQYMWTLLQYIANLRCGLTAIVVVVVKTQHAVKGARTHLHRRR